jgi:two-component system, cell cycle sensor histidine kinase and response regulator CckA
MATHDLSRDQPDIHRTSRRGSAFLVLLLAALLIAAVAALTLAGRGQAEPYVMVLLAGVGAVGVFALLAAATGIIRIAGDDFGSPVLKQVVDAADAGIVVTDAAGRVTYANAAYRALAGGGRSNEVPPIELAFGSDAASAEAIYRLFKGAREGNELREDVQVKPAHEDRPRWVRLHVRQLADGARRPSIVWTVSELSREREAPLSAGDAEGRHEPTIDRLDDAPVGWASFNTTGDGVSLNKTLAGWLGCDSSDLPPNQDLADLIGSEAARRLTPRPSDERPVQAFDVTLKGKSGEPLPVRIFRWAEAANPGRLNMLVLRRPPEDEPQRAPGLSFMQFFQNTPMAIATVNRAGKIARANGLFARLFHSTRPDEDARPEGRSILDTVAERDRPALEAHLRLANSKQGDSAPFDAALGGKGERWARFYVTPADRDDEEAAIVYALEVTEQRSLENQFLQSQKLETVGQLAGGLAHDFNNVLSAIMMATDFLLNAHRPSDPSFADIMQIKQNANRAASLVRQLLAFSRRQTLRPQVLDLGEALADLSILLRRLIGEKVTLQLHARDVWPVKADLSQFEQVIVNLAVNARDAMPNGGKLSVGASNVTRADARTFETWNLPAGDYVSVEVADTGTGIPPEIIDRIFEPFFSTKEVGKGTGLGLSTVYGIVKQTGGFVFPQSELGKGTTFRIFLPRYVPTEREQAVPKPVSSEARSRTADDTGQGTILLVEDEEGLRGLNARGLKSRGYQVLEAGNGVEAIDVLERHPGKIDLVVSDVVMPEMDGPALLKVLRERLPDLRIIFVSGYAEEAFAKSLPEGGQFEFLPKPFTLKQLIAKVKDTMAEPEPLRSA